LIGNGYIPVTIQDARFRVIERFQFKATLCNKGYSLIKNGNDEVILLKRFFDGVKNDLFSSIKCKMEQPFYQLNTLPKSFLTPTEIMHFEW
jgi:hypothetical protein